MDQRYDGRVGWGFRPTDLPKHYLYNTFNKVHQPICHMVELVIQATETLFIHCAKSTHVKSPVHSPRQFCLGKEVFKKVGVVLNFSRGSGGHNGGI